MANHETIFNDDMYYITSENIENYDDIKSEIESRWPSHIEIIYNLIDISDQGSIGKHFIICMNREVFPFLKNYVPFIISPYQIKVFANVNQDPYKWIIKKVDQAEISRYSLFIRSTGLIYHDINIIERKNSYILEFSKNEQEKSIAYARSTTINKFKIDIKWADKAKIIKENKSVKTEINKHFNLYELLEQDVETD